ncbi:MAG: type II toxin-antitoxin system VapC family toxin [Anaerolineae bacterium]
MAGAGPVVIDANVAVALAVLLPWSADAEARIAGWQRTRTPIYAPMLWEYEAASALRKLLVAGKLSQDAAERGLELLLAMGVQRVAPDAELHRTALQWADRLGQVVAYDAQYLALAERLGATLWTADRRLAQIAGRCGVEWVRPIAAQ